MNVNIVYENGNKVLEYRGVTLGSGFDKFLHTRVNNRYYDLEGTKHFANMFDSINETGFDPTELLKLGHTRTDSISWKIGESIAECYLEDFEDAVFPYNTSRDDRNLNANSQGADLIGFVTLPNVLFLFGEVKTSHEARYPPSVVHGPTGLTSQMNKLKSDNLQRRTLVRWLGYKISSFSAQNQKLYRKALYAYAESNGQNVVITGVLLRDVDPNPKDLTTAYKNLIKGMPNGMQLKLLALYILPLISDLPTKIGGNPFGN